jgi:AraC-like DNA-binding protein
MARFIGKRAHEDIGVGDVAAAAGLHPNYASTIFKRADGLTINQSIVRHRLDAARSMLVSSDRPVAQIAFASGFGSLSRFYQAFEQRFHSPPGAFRQKIVG